MDPGDEAQKAKKNYFFETAPSPPTPPFLTVWISHYDFPPKQKKWLLQRGGHNCGGVAVNDDSTVPRKSFAKEVLFEW